MRHCLSIFFFFVCNGKSYFLSSIATTVLNMKERFMKFKKLCIRMQGHIFHCSLYVSCSKYGGFCCWFFPSCITECTIHIILCYISLSFLVLSFLPLHLLLFSTFFSFLLFYPTSISILFPVLLIFSIFILFSSLQFCPHSLQIYFSHHFHPLCLISLLPFPF